MQAVSRTDVNSNMQQAALLSNTAEETEEQTQQDDVFNLLKTKNAISLSALVECRSRIHLQCCRQPGSTVQKKKGC